MYFDFRTSEASLSDASSYLITVNRDVFAFVAYTFKLFGPLSKGSTT